MRFDSMRFLLKVGGLMKIWGWSQLPDSFPTPQSQERVYTQWFGLLYLYSLELLSYGVWDSI